MLSYVILRFLTLNSYKDTNAHPKYTAVYGQVKKTIAINIDVI